MNRELIPKPYVGECAICLEDNVRLCKFMPCSHVCICVTCLLKIDLKNLLTCCLCRAKVLNIITDSDQRSKVLTDNFGNPAEFFNTLIEYFRTLRKQGSGTYNCKHILVSICEIALSYLDGTEKSPLLTVSQTEILLTMVDMLMLKTLDQWFLIEKALVACCRIPWQIDVKVAPTGVCYHGNFGEPPASILEGLDLLSRNYQSLRSPESFVFKGARPSFLFLGIDRTPIFW